jgi:hypothetical protein
MPSGRTVTLDRSSLLLQDFREELAAVLECARGDIVVLPSLRHRGRSTTRR